MARGTQSVFIAIIELSVTQFRENSERCLFSMQFEVAYFI